MFAVITLVFLDVFAGSGFYERDVFRFHYPMKRIVREIVLSGEFPGWNPYFAGGQPLAANPQYEVFYPPQWLILLPSYRFGFQLHVLVHFYLAAFGMFALLKSLRLGAPAAAFGALSFSLGGFFVSCVELMPFMFSLTWMPFILATARSAMVRASARNVALLAMFGGLQALVGEPVTLAQTWLLVACLALYFIWNAAREDRPRTARRVAAVVLLGGLWAASIGAVQLLPAAYHARDSIRSRGFSFEKAATWSMPPLRPLELLQPDVFGVLGPGRDDYWGGRAYGDQGFPFISRIYCGAAVALLFFVGIAARHRYALPALLVVALSYLLAIGSHTPIFRILFDLGVVSSIRYPEKFAFMGLFGAIVFAAAIADRLSEPKIANHAVRIAVAIMLLMGAAWIVTLTPNHAALFDAAWKRANPAWLALDGTAWMRAALIFASLALVMIAFVRAARPRMAWSLFALIVLIDLTVRVGSIAPRIAAPYFDPPDMAQYFQRDRGQGRLFHQADWFRGSAVGQAYMGEGSLRTSVVRNGMFPMSAAAWGISTVLERDYDETFLLGAHELSEAMWEMKASGRGDWAELFMSISNAWYRVLYRPFDEAVRGLAAPEKIHPVAVVPGPRVPRAYFAEEVVIATDGAELARVSPPDRHAIAILRHGTPALPAPGRVFSFEERAGRIAIDAEADGDSILVVSVSAHKHWTASVDGRPAELIPTNFAFQSMRLGKGRHQIVLRYHNAWIAYGAMLTVLALILALIFACRRGSSLPA